MSGSFCLCRLCGRRRRPLTCASCLNQGLFVHSEANATNFATNFATSFATTNAAATNAAASITANATAAYTASSNAASTNAPKRRGHYASSSVAAASPINDDEIDDNDE